MKEEHKRNLKKLALFLIDRDCNITFNMVQFCKRHNYPVQEPKYILNECNTICCAVGTIPLISPESVIIQDYSTRIKWMETCGNFCGIFNYNSREFTWLFSPKWAFKDNSKLGTAKRILNYLRIGLPANWIEQLHDKHILLSYTGEF